MPTCFVIQPFDEGKFDKRYKQTFSPAVIAAGLTPYRVDEDPGVEVPIEAIEKGIRDATICLADITTDNPNVWYELGYSMAIGRQVVMICSTEREGKYPFDIQHRSVIRYKVDAPEDFVDLQEKITEKIKVLLQKRETLQEISRQEPLAPVAGLTQGEMTVLALVAGAGSPDEWVSRYSVKQEAEKDYLTPLGFGLALKRLLQKGFLDSGFDHDDNNDYDYPALKLTDSGWGWIDQNEARFVIRREPKGGYSRRGGQQVDDLVQSTDITDDDIPF